MTSLPARIVVANGELLTDLCPRTLCLYRPGEPIIGEQCHYVWTGRIPCTGSKRCTKCGTEIATVSR